MKDLMEFAHSLKIWFFNDKTTAAFKAAAVNAAYGYEVEKETEKAIQIRIYKKEIPTDWLIWFPKSVIEK